MGTVRVWTVQPWVVWEQLVTAGKLTVDPRYSANLHHCYEWLRVQLVHRVAGYSGHYPWWAYGTRPDLRRVRHLEPRGERYALIDLELPRDRVAVFPFWAWDRIFYGKYLSPGRRESADWHRRLREVVADEDSWPLPEPWHTELEASWDWLFSAALPVNGWSPGPRAPLSDWEAVFEVLDRGHVSGVTPFLGAGRGRPARSIQQQVDTRAPRLLAGAEPCEVCPRADECLAGPVADFGRPYPLRCAIDREQVNRLAGHRFPRSTVAAYPAWPCPVDP